MIMFKHKINKTKFVIRTTIIFILQIMWCLVKNNLKILKIKKIKK